MGVQDPSKPGVFEFRMPSSYVYLGGTLDVKPVTGAGGSIIIELSDNNGLDWKPLAKVTATGQKQIDLKPFVYRRYDYRLRFTLNGKVTGLDAVRVSHDIQHSQRPLPALSEGSNAIHFSEGTQEGTITINPSTNPDMKGKNAYYTDFHPDLKNVADPKSARSGRVGGNYFSDPYAGRDQPTPCRRCIIALAILRTAGTFRHPSMAARAGRMSDNWKVRTAASANILSAIPCPRGSHDALVRFSGTQRNTTLILDLRIDADYHEPHGGFAPVKVTYIWDEIGQARESVHIATQADETWDIHCAGKPIMKSIVLER